MYSLNFICFSFVNVMEYFSFNILFFCSWDNFIENKVLSMSMTESPPSWHLSFKQIIMISKRS